MDTLVALVTAASSGIGAATAECLAGAGFRVGLLARRHDKLQDVAAQIRTSGGIVQIINADIARQAEAAQAVRDVVRTFGRLDVLVNNAGVTAAGSWLPAGRSSRTYVHKRPVLVLPLPGSSTGTGTSSPCSFSAASTYFLSASTSGCKVRLAPPTQSASVERSSSMPSRR